jgi:hypothetical protein
MNERIKELAKQATVKVNNPFVNSDGEVVCDSWEEGISIQKFAELLIKECGEIAVLGDPRYSAQHNIHKHFGVE